MSFRYKVLTVAITAISLIIVFCFSAHRSLAQAQQMKKKATVVNAVPVQFRKVKNTLEAIATTKSSETVTITANVTEFVKKLHFDHGDKVNKDDVLVELETREEEALLQEAKARVEEAQAQYERIKTLTQKNFSAEAEHDVQLAELHSRQAKLQQIEVMIADRTLKAPFSGLLGFRKISEGSLIEPGDEIVRLDKIQPLNVDFNLPEKYFSQIHTGQRFEAMSTAYQSKVFEGKIISINPQIDEQSRSIAIRGSFANHDLLLRPGMLLRVIIPLGEETVMTIPEDALLAEGMERYIFILKQNGKKAQKIKVKLLNRRNRSLDIQANLPENSWVVTDGAFKLKDGQPVEIKHVAR